ncbi:MAG: HisA/HisF-related TIM barrel protein [Verrucomicrobia bacterium]|nr:HisA/HisF-related TIM barrel protein [Verrucomicrobiota bacterium]
MTELRKRVIGVVTVLDGWAVQSFGYARQLPLGKPECVVENLDRWGADEILVLAIDRSRRNLGPDLATLARLATLNLGTPLIYGGGIRSAAEGVAVVQAGADRVCVDALLRDDLPAALNLAGQLGAQAVIAALPLSLDAGELRWRDYRREADTPLHPDVIAAVAGGQFSEALLIDWRHEGRPGGFDPGLLSAFPVQTDRLILFGGLSETEQIATALAHPAVTAVGVGNFLNYREHAVQSFKSGLGGLPVRPPRHPADPRSCPSPS